MFSFRPFVFIPAAALLIVIVGGRFFISASIEVPQDFFDVRDQAGILAESIVQQSRQSLTRLSQIGEFDANRNFRAALDLVSKELAEHQHSQDIAAQLASQLEIMARLLPDIKPASAKEWATEAVSAEVALVSRLVTYNDRLRDLFVVLELKFNSPGGRSDLDGRVNELVNDINDQAKAINQFNKRFNDAMLEFDKIVRR